MANITSRNEQFQKDFTQQSLYDFFEQQSGDSELSKSLLNIDTESLAKFINQARLTLLIACGSIKEQSVIKQLQNQADNGLRIYLLLDDASQNQMAIDMLSGRCLIRTGIKQHGTLVLRDHATSQAQGFLFTNNNLLMNVSTESRAIELEPMQREDSYRSFCKLFWENTNYEYLQHNQQEKAVSNPDGRILVNHSHHLHNSLEKCLSDPLSSLEAASCLDFKLPNAPSKLLLTTASDLISNKANDGIALTECYIPNILFSDNGDWLLPDGSEFSSTNWCLKLSVNQSKQIRAAFEQAHHNAAWQFKHKATLGDLTVQQAVRFSEQPHSVHIVEALKSQRIKDISTKTMDDFFNKSADELAINSTQWQPDRLAHYIEFSVKIHPPYCPQGAKKDALYQQWQNTEKSWQRQLSELETLQNTINRQQENIGDSLKVFIKSFLLGQGQSLKQFNKELETLKAWSVTTATPAERETYRKRLADLQQEIQQRNTDTSKNLDKAKQHQDWENKKLALKTNLEQKTAVATQQEANFKQKSDEKEAAFKQAEQNFIESWQKASASLNKEQLNKLNLPELKANAESQPLASEDIQNVLSSMTIDQANSWKKTFKEKIWKKHYPDFAKALSNISEANKKIERDIQEAQKASQQSSLQRQQAAQTLEDHGEAFIYQPNRQSDALDQQLGLKTNHKQPNRFVWPDEDLPFGQTELRQYKQQRYLLINKKQQLEQAKNDAARLNAKIVCDREAGDA